jgi:hypothetical protein
MLQLSNTQPTPPNPTIVQGPHKQHLAQCLHENGDSLACKRAKKQASSAAPTLSTPVTLSTPLTASASPMLQVPEGATASNQLAASASLATDTTNSSGDSDSNGIDTQPIDIDDSDIELVEENGEDGDADSEGEATKPDKGNEDDEAELGKSSISIFDLINY